MKIINYVANVTNCVVPIPNYVANIAHSLVTISTYVVNIIDYVAEIIILVVIITKSVVSVTHHVVFCGNHKVVAKITNHPKCIAPQNPPPCFKDFWECLCLK